MVTAKHLELYILASSIHPFAEVY